MRTFEKSTKLDNVLYDVRGPVVDEAARMEEDGITLEESFAGYEEGMKLLKYCNEKIDRVEKQVQKMNAEGQLEDFE